LVQNSTTYFMNKNVVGRKEKTRKKSHDTGTEKKTGKHQDMEKGEGKSIEHQRTVCLKIKDRST